MLYLCKAKTSLSCLLCIRPYSLSFTSIRGFHFKIFILSREWWFTSVNLECAWYVQGSWFKFQYCKEKVEKGNDRRGKGKKQKQKQEAFTRWGGPCLQSALKRWHERFSASLCSAWVTFRIQDLPGLQITTLSQIKQWFPLHQNKNKKLSLLSSSICTLKNNSSQTYVVEIGMCLNCKSIRTVTVLLITPRFIFVLCFLGCLFWDRVSLLLCSYGYSGTDSIDQADLELIQCLLSLTLQCWDWRHVLPLLSQ